jgi:aminoglycoside/choline kinase family phosphotransferase
MKEVPLEGCLDGEPAVEELRVTLREVAGSTSRVAAVHKLKTGVYRIGVATPARRLSIVAKRLSPAVAQRNQLALERWLPAAGLERAAPALLGVAAERAGRSVWHLYEDLGDSTLANGLAGPDALRAAIRLVARIHARFVRDPVLPECRNWGEDHGIGFYDSSIRDAIAAVAMLIDGSANGRREVAACERLLDRLERLAGERDGRARELADLGGPDTLLHGDLWLENATVLPGPGAPQIRLIDWDHVGVGSFSYDLSTLVFRFPRPERAGVVDLYRRAAQEHDVPVPGDEELGALFTTAECARLANIAIWPAVAATREGARWAFDQLAEIDEWFEPVQARCVA